MELFDYKRPRPSETSYINLYCLGDLHIGHRNFDEKKYHKAIETIKNDPHGRVFFVGDIADNRNPRHKHFDTEQLDQSIPFDKFTATCYNIFEKSITPIKEKVLGICSGNHDRGDQYQNPYIEIMCDKLKIKYLGYLAMGIINFQIFNQRFSYSVCITHGSGSGSSSGAKINRVEALAQSFDCNIYIHGHNHYGSITDGFVLRPIWHAPQRKIMMKEEKKIYVNSCTFLKTYQEGNFSYTEHKAYKPTQTGYVVVKITPKHNLVTGYKVND